MVTLAAGAACRRSGQATPDAAVPRPILGEVTVEEATTDTPPPAKLDPRLLAAELRQRALLTGLFDTTAGAGDAAPAPAAPRGTVSPIARIRIDLRTEVAEVKDRGAARAVVRLRIETRPRDAPGALAEDVTAAAEQLFSTGSGVSPAPDRAALFAKLIVRTVGDLLDGLAARARLRQAGAVELAAAMRADGGELREEAIRVAGQRRARETVPALLDLLNHPDEPVRDAALGALLEMKEARAVPVLTRTRSFRDSREMRKILDAVATLGGKEALDYLAFVAETHDDAEIRQMAASARTRLARRDAGAGP